MEMVGRELFEVGYKPCSKTRPSHRFCGREYGDRSCTVASQG